MIGEPVRPLLEDRLDAKLDAKAARRAVAGVRERFGATWGLKMAGGRVPWAATQPGGGEPVTRVEMLTLLADLEAALGHGE